MRMRTSDQKALRMRTITNMLRLGPRSLRTAVDEDAGKIHFIVLRFLEKNRMYSEAQRMLLIKNNAGA